MLLVVHSVRGKKLLKNGSLRHGREGENEKKPACAERRKEEELACKERKKREIFYRSAEKIAENNNKVRMYKRHGFFCSVSTTEASIFSVME